MPYKIYLLIAIIKWLNLVSLTPTSIIVKAVWWLYLLVKLLACENTFVSKVYIIFSLDNKLTIIFIN